nr:glycosyltransferase family 4 protein [uncultured Romboutsia sp.]
MKILVVTQYFWPEEFRINDICEGLVEKGHEVEVLTGLPNYPYGKLFEGYSFKSRGPKEYKGIKINRCYLIERGQDSSIKLALNYLSFMINSLFHIPKLAKKKFDNIFVFQVSPITSAIPAIVLGKLKRIPTSIYIQDLWPETFYSIKNINNKNIRNTLKKICIKIYDTFDQIVIASEGYRDILVKSGINEEKIVYLPQWAEDIYSDNNLNENVIAKDNEDFVVTFAGNIGKAQSVDTIIKAAKLAKQNRNIKWIILGDGSEFNNIKELVEKYNLKDTVKLLGRKPSTDMPKYFNQSDALIVTLKNTDILRITLPAKVQSYMASGKPILGSISGSGMEAIKSSNCGLVSEAEDYNELYNKVIQLYNMDEIDRKKLGNNGKQYFKQNFERNMLLNRLEGYLKSIIKNIGDEEYVQG